MEDCTPKLSPSKPGEYIKDITDEMKRLNVTAVVFADGGPEWVAKYEALAPGRVIPGIAFKLIENLKLIEDAPPKEEQLKMLEHAFTDSLRLRFQPEQSTSREPTRFGFFCHSVYS